jgi:hypothetical protein
MKEYLNKIYSIINDARLAIIDEGNKEQEIAKDDAEKEKIKIASLHYDVLLNGILTFKNEIEDKIDEKAQLLNNTGIKIVLNEEPMDDVQANGAYAYEGDVGAFVTDEDPVIIETKSGKKIVLDSDPVFYIDNTGKKIVLDEDPKFELGNKIVLDEDPISIMTKTGRKIILDEDPVGNTLVSNKVIVLSEDPIFNLGTTGNAFSLDEDPIFHLDEEEENKSNEEVVDSIQKIRDILRNMKSEQGKVITLDEEPKFNIESDGNTFTINEEVNTSNSKIVLDEDTVNIRIDVTE